MKNLPAALFSGVRIREVDMEKAFVTVPYKWFTKNPFRSTYFACLSMAAEMSTGVLAMGHIYKRRPKISMLVVGIEGKFYKKATGLTRFACEEGMMIKQAIETAIATGNAQTIKVLAAGYNSQQELVAEFWITWSFKVAGDKRI